MRCLAVAVSAVVALVAVSIAQSLAVRTFVC
jgi:hypothetical protein